MKVEPRHTFSIYLPASLYQRLLDKAGKGKVSTFIKQVLEEKLIKEEQQQKEKLRQQLIAAHKRISQNQKLKKELTLWDETADDYINDEKS
ncbi:MAG: hypothetical protein MRECE_1c110 [Mycoplasmataceae bacterium CE_OT135]|nr:MAG: hypothetical protein MRECE_1c057 [Mycoplasmataceae bacterium CE_OT135]KLL04346.1 MAG: hypothetical protein MRECE_1c110 [Mycoplasmataceae bacterium CE_OT135]